MTNSTMLNGIHGNVEENEELLSQKATEIARGMELPMAMKSALELGILDSISEANNKDGAFLSASEVAAKIPGCVNPNAPTFLDCLLSFLASYSVLKCQLRNKIDGEQGQEKVYGVGPICKYFVANKEGGSMAPLFSYRYSELSRNIWSHLSEAIKEGGTAFEKACGMKLYEYSQKEKGDSKEFNEVMWNNTVRYMKKVLDVYKGFEEINVLVDVGGGIGASLMLITSKYPNISGINFDLSHVVADAPTYPGVKHVGGDMFEQVPRGDAILLKYILHNWNNKDCERILKKCWKAIPSKGKVIVIEKVVPLVPEDKFENHVTLASNLTMYSMFEATERTIEDYIALAMASGFSDCRPICSAGYNWVIELLKD